MGWMVKRMNIKFYTADKQTGTFIDEFENLERAKEEILKYEKDDKKEGTYEEDFYDVVDFNHESVMNGNITIGLALQLDGYTEKEALNQMKIGASLYSPDDYFSTLEDCKIEEEVIQDLRKRIENAPKKDGAHCIHDGVSVIRDGKNIYILELCL